MFDNDDGELQKALEPVRRHFSGREVTPNTVLAAYLRSAGLPVFGDPWDTAKNALRAGYSFEQAARVASMTTRSEVAAQTRPSSGAPSPFQGRQSLGWFPKKFGPGDIDGVGAKRLLGTPNIDHSSVLVREMAQNSWDARGVSLTIDFTMNLRLLDEPLIETLRQRVFTENAPGTGLAALLARDQIWALEVTDRNTVGLGGPIRNDLAIEPGIDRNFIDLVFNIGAPRDVHLGGGTYGFGKTITYVVSSVGTLLIWSRCEGSHGIEDRLIGSAIGEAFNEGGNRYTGRHWWGNVISTENRVEPMVGASARKIGETIFSAHFGEGVTGTSILILDPQLGGDSPEESVKLLNEAVAWNLWPKLIPDQSNQSQMNISIQLNGKPVTQPDIRRHPVLNGYTQALLAVRAADSKAAAENGQQGFPVKLQEIWCSKPQILLGHLALTRYPAPPDLEHPAHSVALMRQAELVVKYMERRELDVEGFQWAGVFKPVMDVDDSFAMAEPPAHDDWVPQAVEDKKRRREVNVALKRIREAVDQYLMPKDQNVSSGQDLPGTAVFVADMLGDLVAGQQGSGATRVTVKGDGGLGVTITPTSEDEISFAVNPQGHDVDFPPTQTPEPARASGPDLGFPPSQGPTHGPSDNPTPMPGTGTLPGRKRRGRPKIEVTAFTRTSASIPGWSRTVVEIQNSATSPTAAMVDLSIRVGVEGGSMDDSEVVRIIGWKNTAEAYDPSPQALEPGVSREFVYESRSDLAIDLETKLVNS